MFIRSTILLIFFCWVLPQPAIAQLVDGSDTLYGNEWIDYERSYLRIEVAEDGIYRMTYADLIAAGATTPINGNQLQLYQLGREQRIYVSNEGTWQDGDYLEFFGRRNRSELDRYLFEDPDASMLNPEYSLITDTSVYFLSWTGSTSNVRFSQIPGTADGSMEPRTWYHHTEQLILSEEHFKPVINSEQVRYSDYQMAEGYGGPEGVRLEYSLGAESIAPEGGDAQVNFRMTGDLQDHNVQVQLNGDELTRFQFSGPRLIDSTINFPGSALRQNNTFVASTAGTGDKIRLSMVGITYPRQFIFGNDTKIEINIDDARNGALLEMEGLRMTEARIFDLGGGFLIEQPVLAGTVTFQLPPGPNVRKILIVEAGSGNMQPVAVRPVTFEDLRTSDAQFLLISHPALIGEVGTGPVAAYAAYRQSTEGGSYRTRIIDIRQLTDQFAYGIMRHPLSIKNFSNYIHDQWSDPRFLFLIGKGITYPQARTAAPVYDYLPVYGFPGSDNLLTSRLNSSVPLIPTGRLAVRSQDQIQIYLDKIKVMEDQIANAPQTIADRGWMKRVLHLSGGNNTGNEQDIIFNKMNEMATIIEQNSLGAKVSTIRNTTQDVITASQSEEAIALINDGIILKNYFGHGGVTSTQFDRIEKPEYLSNKDRYPIMMALGCLTGNLFIPTQSLSEDNVLAANKGGIIYLATSGLGFLQSLDLFAKELYKSMGDSDYLQPIGVAVQTAIQRLDTDRNLGIVTLVQQLTFHGDPAYRIAVQDGPDYIIDRSTIRTIPTIINAELDSFTVEANLVNLGKLQQDSISIQLQHTTPTGRQYLYNKTFYADRTSTGISFSIPVFREEIVGRNVIGLIIDPEEVLDEKPLPGASRNNGADGQHRIEFLVFDSDIRMAYPPEYSIVTRPEIKLVATLNNPLTTEQNYIVEIDTIFTFDSPLQARIPVRSQGGFIEFDGSSFPWQQKKVHYWRITTDSLLNLGFPWKQSSFLYDPEGETGWHQSDIAQLASGRLTDLEIDTAENALIFQRYYRDITLISRLPAGDSLSEIFVGLTRPPQNLWFDRRSDVLVVMFDPVGFNPIPTTGNRRYAAFNTNDIEGRKNFMDYIKQINPGNFVVVFTQINAVDQNLHTSEWGQDSLTGNGVNIFNVLEAQGATLVRQLENHQLVPYAFAFKKDFFPIQEAIGSSPSEEFQFTALLSANRSQGKLTSRSIGPVKRWKSLNIELHKEPADSVILYVTGQNENQLFNDLIPDGGISATLDEYSLDASDQLVLNLEYIDQQDQSPALLHSWSVFYDPLSDFSFGTVDREILPDTLSEGESIPLSFPVHNISETPSDSILIAFTLTDLANKSIRTKKKYGALKPFGQQTIEHTLETTGLSGPVQLTVAINPDDDQAEADHWENFLLWPLYILSDQQEPLLDITFDGVNIFNGDIVSPKPEIIVQLKDENPNIFLNDSTSLELRLKKPSDGEYLLVTNDQYSVRFPNTQENLLELTWTPTFEESGNYSLLVGGEDPSGNQTAQLRKDFQVILKKTISEVIPYPNPFTSFTRFAYTLTGEEPTHFSIRIFTLSGQLVKQIDKSEFGPMRIGKHLSDYKWFGEDDFGGKLANGIYLYSVSVKDESGEQFETRQVLSNPDYMEKGYGKLVILR